MSGDRKGTYEVGYKKPPKATRFQKGKSGNPDGQRKKVTTPLDPASVLQAIENEEIIVLENGERKPMRKLEAHFRQLFTTGTKGDLKMARAAINLAERYFAPEARTIGPGEIMSQSDARRRFGKNWEDKVDEFNSQF